MPIDRNIKLGMRLINSIHFIGIGGSGMCGIAEVLSNQGYRISGSDECESSNTQRLRDLGLKIFIGHNKNNLKDADVVVISSAIDKNNSEVLAAKEAQLPIVPRAEMLAELMRFNFGIAVAGTHGKTTTTSLLASIFADAGLDPTYVIGGLLNSANTNAKLGNSRYFIAEADESDASFLHLQPMVSVVTNIDSDHISAYQNQFENLRNAFVEFVHNLPFYGLAVVCVDDECIRESIPDFHRPVISYGFNDISDFKLTDYRNDGLQAEFYINAKKFKDPVKIKLNTPGIHNALNATAAFIVADYEGIPLNKILKSLGDFKGVARRFDIKGEIYLKKGPVTLIDDYGHHPTEIEATVRAARASWPEKKIVMIYQPHRYSRTKLLYKDFVRVLSSVDSLVLLDIYSAGEDEIEGINSAALAKSISQFGVINPLHVSDIENIPDLLINILEKDNLLITQGAGDISKLSRKIQEHGFL